MGEPKIGIGGWAPGGMISRGKGDNARATEEMHQILTGRALQPTADITEHRAVRMFGRYRLIRPLGVGGMGEVWLASQTSETGIEKTVALKLVRSGTGADATRLKAMFHNEMRVSMMLSHSNIVQVFDCGVIEEKPFFVMEWVDGLDLSQLLEYDRAKGNLWSIEVCVYVLSEVLRALQYAHELQHVGGEVGVVHRDISPHNILCSVSGEIKIVDFGVARLIGEETTGLGPKGKLRYMSPEQLRGDRVDHRCDLYAAGAIFHEMLSGERFRGAVSGTELYERTLRGEIPPLARNIPPALEAVRRALLEPDVAKRLPSAGNARGMLSWLSTLAEARVTLAQKARDSLGVVRPRTGVYPQPSPLSGEQPVAAERFASANPSPAKPFGSAADNHLGVGAPEPTVTYAPSEAKPEKKGSRSRTKVWLGASMGLAIGLGFSYGGFTLGRRSELSTGALVPTSQERIANIGAMPTPDKPADTTTPIVATVAGNTELVEVHGSDDSARNGATARPIDDKREKTTDAAAESTKSKVRSPTKAREMADAVLRVQGYGFVYAKIDRQEVVIEPRLEMPLSVGAHRFYYRRDPAENWTYVGRFRIPKMGRWNVVFTRDKGIGVTALEP